MADKMSFNDLFKQIAKDTDSSEKVIRELKKQMGIELRAGLKRDGSVHLKGLGTFYLKWSEEREGINPQTGEKVNIPAHEHITFRSDVSVRKKINKEYENLKIFLLGESDKKEPVEVEESKEQEIKTPGWMWVLVILLVLSLIASLLFKKEIIIIEEVPVIKTVMVTNEFSTVEEVIISEEFIRETPVANQALAPVIIPVDEDPSSSGLSDEENIEEFVTAGNDGEKIAPVKQIVSDSQGEYVDSGIANAEAGFAEGKAEEAILDAKTANLAAEIVENEAENIAGSKHHLEAKKEAAAKAKAAAHDAEMEADEAIGTAMLADDKADAAEKAQE